jgi:hypothetical protein
MSMSEISVIEVVIVGERGLPGEFTAADIANQSQALAGTAGKLIDAERLRALRGVANGDGSLDANGLQPIAEVPAKVGGLAAGYIAGLPTGTYVGGVMGGSDSAATIQPVIDAHIYDLASNEARAPIGDFRLAKGLNVGYGVSFKAGRLFGSGMGFNSDPGRAGTTFYCDFLDQPGVSIQGGRNFDVGHFSLIGRLRPYMLAEKFGREDCVSAVDDRIAANWVDPALLLLDARISSQNAPLAGIAIDPRSGAKQANYYADVVSDLVTTQYKKNFSNQTRIHDVELQGWYVGIVTQPNSYAGSIDSTLSDGNGDFVWMRRITIQYCAYGLASSQTQNREFAGVHVYIHTCHTGLTNRAFGRQTGRFGDGFSYHVDQTINIYDFGDGFNLSGLYLPIEGETSWREGNFLATTTISLPLTIKGKISFEGQILKRGVPLAMVSGGICPFKWDGGSRENYYSSYLIDMTPDQVTIDNTMMKPRSTEIDTGSTITTAVKAAQNATLGGIMFPAFGATSRLGDIRPKFTPWNLDTGSAVTAPPIIRRSTYPSNRTICTPLWVERHSASGDPSDPGVIIPRSARAASFSPTSLGLSGAITGRTITGTFPGGWTAIRKAQYFGSVGDMVWHAGKKRWFVLTSLPSGSDFVLTLQNGFDVNGAFDPAASFIADVINFTGATLYVASGRWYSPALPVYGRFTSGSPTITEVGLNAVGTQVSASIDTNIGATDTIIVDDPLAPFVTQANAILTARDDSAKTMTMTGNALKDSAAVGPGGADRIRIGTLARTLT